LYSSTSEKLDGLVKDFCGFVKTKELMPLVHEAQIKTSFYNPINFWHLWDNATPIGDGYYLCSRYLDTLDYSEFSEKMLAQITASYLQDSHDRENAENEPEPAEIENYPMLSASLSYFSYDAANSVLDLSVTPSKQGIDGRDLEILNDILTNGYDGHEVKKISLTYLTGSGALQDNDKIAPMNIALQFYNDQGEWEVLN